MKAAFFTRFVLPFSFSDLIKLLSYFVFKSDLEFSNSMEAAMAKDIYHQKFNGYFDIYSILKCNAEEPFVPLQTENIRDVWNNFGQRMTHK